MKRVSYLFILFLFIDACKKPSPVKNTEEAKTMSEILMQKFPTAQDIVWDTLETERVASFFDGQYDNAVYFDSLGQFLYRIIFIEPQTLPISIQEALYKKYKPSELALVQKVEDAQKISYHIEFETNTDYIILNYDEKGNLLNEKKDPLSIEEQQRQEEEGVDDNN
jgi:hypothetical protein